MIIYGNIPENKNSIKLIGNSLKIGEVKLGGTYTFIGEYETNKWGTQFKVVSQLEPPFNGDGDVFLLSGQIKGIKESTAQKIIEYFGNELDEVLNNYIDRLTEVPGIGKKKLKDIKDSIKEKYKIKDLIVFLRKHDIGMGFLNKIYEKYGNESVDKIKSNPYILITDIKNIGFKKADTMALKLGFETNGIDRIKAYIMYILKESVKSGHCFLGGDEVCDMTSKLDSKIIHNDIINALNVLINEELIVIEGINIYISDLYFYEKNTVDQLGIILNFKPSLIVSGDVIKATIVSIEMETGFRLHETQILAIVKALKEKISIISGGAGTGKTTICKAIYNVFNSSGNLSINIVAPTGKAARRASQAINAEAETIHKFLGYKNYEFEYNIHNKKDTDVLIIDEASMIDITLFSCLLDALKPSVNIIIIGDSFQLASVGAGNVLADLIYSGKIPVTFLERTFRQEKDNKILINANKVRHGKRMDYSNTDNFSFLRCEDYEDYHKVLQTLVIDYFENKKVTFELLEEFYFGVQFVSPMRKGEIGTSKLNDLIRGIIFNDLDQLKHKFHVYDKVMNISNDYDNNIMNGEVGIVRDINDESMIIKYIESGKDVEYSLTKDNDKINNIVLSYVSTVHKLQGSEFKCVVFVIDKSQFFMLQRNLLYTGITRAKIQLILLSNEQSIEIAINNNKPSIRNTSLKEKLQQCL